MNFLVVKRLPRRATLLRLGEATGELLSLHEGLRTVFKGGIQHAAGSGELEIGVHEADGESRRLAEEVGARLQSHRFDLETELPLRMAVITEGGVPRLAVFVLPHTAVDAISLAAVVRDWERLLLGEGPAGPAPLQPVDLAESELAPPVTRRAAAALGHWAGGLGRAPQSMFPVANSSPDAMVPRLRVRSVAAAAALDRIAHRTGASRSVIVMAALGVLLGVRTAQRTCLLASLSSNRTHPRLRHHVGPLAQDALVVTDLDAATFDAVIGRFRAAALQGYQHSRFDSAALWEIIHALDAERGTSFARDCVFNDMSQLTPACDEPAPTAEIECTWLPAASLPANLSLWVHRLDQEVDMVLWANPLALPAAEAERFGAGIVRLLVEAGERAVDVTEIERVSGVVPMEHGPGWVPTPSGWVRLEAVRGLVGEAVPGRPAHLATDLTCYVADESGTLTPEGVHQACLALLPGRADAITPRRYVICRDRPETSWTERPVLVEGTGRGLASEAPLT